MRPLCEKVPEKDYHAPAGVITRESIKKSSIIRMEDFLYSFAEGFGVESSFTMIVQRAVCPVDNNVAVTFVMPGFNAVTTPCELMVATELSCIS